MRGETAGLDWLEVSSQIVASLLRRHGYEPAWAQPVTCEASSMRADAAPDASDPTTRGWLPSARKVHREHLPVVEALAVEFPQIERER